MIQLRCQFGFVDKHGNEVFVIDQVGEDRWEADGLVSLGDLERIVGLTVDPELDANTLSGVFMQRLGRMPEAGDQIDEAGFHLRVLSLEDRRVGRAAIERPIDERPTPADDPTAPDPNRSEQSPD